ncbi:hypothetical protein [Photorhabdus bodei]|uniref:Uncharacterized protein n=1 Tax=Photorhabdus bodei TaxID=2029681 RepID=A0A329XCJ8_9GAMM|nr:hypothetical protein [Photorhabdus bodei]NDK98083.1 hypothetical protein [Photorhabdus bodei]NDL02333.1 hypothetical protein [Photorhabdus bodei]NDL06407.1 hypothetical protein [Photorhabdus bodei]RAX14567.1 hypothetical protein CKY02_01320 [Photorhabdus bodei]
MTDTMAAEKQRADKETICPISFQRKAQFLNHLTRSKHQAKIKQRAAKMAIITNVLTAVNKPSFKSVFIEPPQNKKFITTKTSLLRWLIALT